MSSSSTFEYSSDPQASQQVVQDVNHILERENLSLEERYPFILAISEAVTNAIIHGNVNDPQKKVKVSITVNEKLLSADITDEGQGGLDRIRQRKPSTSKDEGGRGIDLIEHFATSVGYVQIPGGGLKVEIRIERKTNSVLAKRNKLDGGLMKITVKNETAMSIVALDGRLDLATGANLKEEIRKVCDMGISRIHLNLQKIEFINSSGLGALVSVMKQVRLKKGRLTLSDLAPYVREIFDITQLSNVFEIHETQHSALTSTEKTAV